MGVALVYLSIFPQNPNEGCLSLRVHNSLKVVWKLGKDHFYHVVKLAKNVYDGEQR